MLTNLFNKTPDKTVPTKTTLKSIKAEMSELSKEKLKLIEILGVEVYDLFKSEGFHHKSILPFLERLSSVDEAFEQLKKEASKLEKDNTNKKVCDCGEKIKADEIYCSKCGTLVKENHYRCSCGTINQNSTAFCSKCGTQNPKHGDKNTLLTREVCICGELLDPNHVICLFCGRSVK